MHRAPSTPASEAFFDDEGQHATADVEARGEALRGLLQLVARARTKQARLLRMECFCLILKVGEGPQTIADVARRSGCTLRRVQQIHRSILDFVYKRG